ncbi:MAG: DUF4071 domain-containing protein [Acidobacteriota bacterium]|nr:DUF4071 domain-containing protein [Acidobacteriota bacterium]MDH3523170.1 DUF4071 domain-containing protein [Acidobacteriota bacterium]
MNDERKACFVVMGFGEKTAYTRDHKPRTLDLDATYETIIKPAVEDAGLRCVRADQMLNSGMIDTRMYEMLLRADLVVADISTGNVNAVYELGVRHALRPHSTIIMLEDQAAFHFDLSHISTFTYHHLGSDIGAREAAKKKAALQALIETIMAQPARDSPVYEFLKGLKEPMMSDADYQTMLTVMEERGDGLQQLIARGKAAKKEGDQAAAAAAFGKALSLMAGTAGGEAPVGQSERDFVTQQLALTTYKSKQPDEKTALERGLEILEGLSPDTSNDTETLGIAGAIRKRLWKLEGDPVHLDKAIEYYGRGFNVKRDYYNGENYASCLVMRAEILADEDEALYDRMTAKKVRGEIVDLLARELAAADVEDRGDRVWMHATMANCLFALSRDGEAEVHETAFRELAGATGWMLETYEAGKEEVLRQRAG